DLCAGTPRFGARSAAFAGRFPILSSNGWCRARPSLTLRVVWRSVSEETLYRKGEAAMALEIFNLTGRVAMITGGSKGLGMAMARGLAEAGADIIISSRHENELQSALDEILRATGRRGCHIVADMGRREDVSK